MKDNLCSALLPDGEWITVTELNQALEQEEVPGFTEEEKEKQLLLQMLEQVYIISNGDGKMAAKMLDISWITLYEKLRKYGTPDG